MFKVRSIWLSACVAVLALLAVPQTSEAQLFIYGRGGLGLGRPYWGGYGGYPYRSGFFGPSYSYSSWYSYWYSYSYPSYSRFHIPSYITNSSAAPSQAAPNLNTSSIEVLCPPEAALWFNGRKSNQKGPTRKFLTPLLSEGSYTYDLRATWKDQSGKEVTRTREVLVMPNQDIVVNLSDEKK